MFACTGTQPSKLGQESTSANNKAASIDSKYIGDLFLI